MNRDAATTSGRKGRPDLTGYEISPLHPIRSVCLALLLSQVAPALFFSCTRDPETAAAPLRVSVRSETGPYGPLDLFLFEEGKPGLLDAYERVEDGITPYWTTCSRCGRRHIAAIANRAGDIYAWSDIRSYEVLAAREVSLAEEEPRRPVMTAEATVDAGKEAALILRPLLAEIRVHSLCCDFHARPYAGAQLEDVRIYLTNVRDRCRLDGESVPSWMNAGRLDSLQTQALAHPEIVFRTLPDPVGDETVFPDIRLYAYPNPAAEDALGAPASRLVIEGSLLGRTCYYPISITPLQGGASHVFNIALTRAGTTDPDIPATPDMVRIQGGVLPWAETDPQIQTF